MNCCEPSVGRTARPVSCSQVSLQACFLMGHETAAYLAKTAPAEHYYRREGIAYVRILTDTRVCPLVPHR